MRRKVTITVGGDVVEYETFMVRGGKAVEITDPEFLAGIQTVMDALRRPASTGPITTVSWIAREEPPRFPMPDLTAVPDAGSMIPAMSDSVLVASIPPCDICADGTTMATVDGKTIHGPWAYMCDAHWKRDGVGRLGTGYGQRLVLWVTAPS